MKIEFKSIAAEFFDLPEDYKISEKISSESQSWEKIVEEQLLLSHFGYARTTVLRTPVLEDRLIELLLPDLGRSRLKRKAPTLCLTHDLDYLKATPQMNLKRTIGRKSIAWKNEDYFSSIRQIVEFDFSVGESSTFFVATPKILGPSWGRIKQWLLDPSYRLSDSEFSDVHKLFTTKNVDVGIHGSFFSHSEKTLQEEVKKLSIFFNKPVIAGRQHWLNLPNPCEDLQRIFDSGIRVDSTLGWNGDVGFRGGLSRPFAVQLSRGRLLLLPMVLMDGALFDDLRLDAAQVVIASKKILEEVYKRNGTVAIDWHERSAHASYGWFAAYEEIVNWAAAMGFVFKSVSDLAREREDYANKSV